MTHMTERERNPVRQGVAALTTIAVAVLLLVLGLLSLFEGISAVADDEVFVPGREYVYEFDTTTWGWIHIVLGGLIVLIALALFTGAVWARVIAVMLAGLSIIANFLWIPYYPWWSVLVIAINIVVIWALSTWRAGA
ncbi:DUF7144 family membrane protein [Nocardia cyriacigeorgica]|uniref:DUF7144 family membrane protein n=1 Tax=Nocardia cyriacigeorgica TaxID=135487 RepID=UPI001895F8FC|nr:hypothetical protein [Nocardia cyriacigeorgica]MBF6160488.1 hypothetical protein [Nocardia cyriacigeorgica]MBF6199745.1 hypothetical protein [Nocardia cyriacigeorgica]MBF6319956.1 hypothetical protein [Nocardia cyriacigeorgica]MBF6517186.1 hypothetical protein [Nocardia cyriacigeorgica]MBF6534374.1 hypothetical protein [Nocardia cyriacigeorgica]